jgi:glycosyltransferase involved in cell wall biosynthesis
MLVARICRRSLVVHLHGAVFQDFYASANRIERWMIRRTLAWVTLGIALTPSLRRTFAGLVPPERLRVLENAIEDPFAGRSEHVLAERERRRSRDEGLRILYVANDFATKGADTLVRALACLRTPRARLRMIGAPPPEVSRATQTLADVLGVGDRVELLGGLTGEEKLRHFEWADVFAYPTENDGQPLVVIEAMAAGLAIVASTFGGVPETVGEAALLVPPGEPERLAESLDRLAEDPELRLKLGRAARRRYVARYTPEPFQAHFEALFADVLPG